jgi:hypothetical protein
MSTTIAPPNKADEFMKATAAFITDQMLKEAEPAIQQALKDIEAKMRARVRQCALAVIDRSMEIDSHRNVLTIRIQQPEGGFKA